MIKTNFMDGYKTYCGLVISFLGLIGVSRFFSSAEVAQIADLFTQIIGLCIAFYGRKVAKLK